MRCEWSLGLPGSGRKRRCTRGDRDSRNAFPCDSIFPPTLRSGHLRTSSMTVQVRHGRDPERFVRAPRHAAVPEAPAKLNARIALFDPKGETRSLSESDGCRLHNRWTPRPTFGYDLLIVGKAALTVDGPAPESSRVRDGLKVIVFEQTSDGPGEAARLPRGGVRAEAGLPARAGPSAPGRARPGAPARLARRGHAPAAAARLRDAAALRPDGQLVRHPRDARLAVRQPRQRRLGPDREARSRRLPADPRRRLQPPVQPAAGVSRGPGPGPLLPARRDRPHRGRPRGRLAGAEHPQYVSAWKPRRGRTVVYAGDPGREAPSRSRRHSRWQPYR